MGRLQGKVAVVTGGNSGIGFAVAQRFAAEGARVFITARRADVLATAAAAIGHGVEPIAADATDAGDLDRLFATIGARADSIDVLVASAGLAEPATLEEAQPVHVERTLALNVQAPLFTVQRALPMIGRGGSIVLVGSIAGAIGTKGYGVYGASKAAVRAFARTWANELADRGIRVNALSPGPIETPMFADADEATRRTLTAAIPLGRLGRPEEVAAAALFLASDESSFITGAELAIDGGMAQV